MFHKSPDESDVVFKPMEQQSENATKSIGSPPVPLSSWVYAATDRLAAMGWVDSHFSGLRPWNRLMFARMVAEAGAKPGLDADLEAASLYAGLAKEFASELEILKGAGERSIQVESLYTRLTSISGPVLNDSYHFGQTVTNDEGRPYGRGVSVISGGSLAGTAGPFYMRFQAEYQHAPSFKGYPSQVEQTIASIDGVTTALPSHRDETNRVRFVEGVVGINLGGWDASFGKQSLWWGPGQGGALLFSNNAEPIYMFRISKSIPERLPGILGLMGPLRSELFIGKLAGHHFPGQPYVHGQKLSFKPTSNLELGFSRTVVLGGVGHPLSFRRWVRSFFSLGDSLRETPADDPGDRRGGFDFSYRLPGLRKWLTLYSDSLVDDDPSPLAAPRRAAMSPGIYLSHVPRIKKLDFRAEAAYTDVPSSRSVGGKFIYWNGQFQDSYTNRGNLLGHPVGREGHALQLWSTYWFSPHSTLQLGYRHGRVSTDFIPGGGRLDDISARTRFWWKGSLEFSGYAQYERWRFPLLASGSQSNFLTSFQMTYWPGWKRGKAPPPTDKEGLRWKPVPQRDAPFQK